MNDYDWCYYKKYFPDNYKYHTVLDLYDVICLTCGERFGEHCGDRCPSDAHYNRDDKFKAPILRTIKGNLPPK